MTTGTNQDGRVRRRTWAIGLATVALLAVAGGAVRAFSDNSADNPEPGVRAATAAIERGTLSGTRRATGSLAYARPRDLTAAGSGVLTWVRQPGSRARPGQALYAVDDQPVHLLRGRLPAWRDFTPGMADGPDVEQLERNLEQLGYFDGTVDEKFTAATAAAVKKWQHHDNQPETGSLPLGRIVFTSGEVRIAAAKAHVGDQVVPGTPVVSVTSLDKQVTVKLRLADQQLAKVGGKVTVTLPVGGTVRGTVTAIGPPTEDGDAEGSTVVIPVTLVLDRPKAAARLQQASVVVDFPSQRRTDVLSVPIGALLALPGNRFGVELVDPDGSTRRVPVRTGLFAGGRVEISGDGLQPGQDVVVPQT